MRLVRVPMITNLDSNPSITILIHYLTFMTKVCHLNILATLNLQNIHRGKSTVVVATVVLKVRRDQQLVTKKHQG